MLTRLHLKGTKRTKMTEKLQLLALLKGQKCSFPVFFVEKRNGK